MATDTFINNMDRFRLRVKEDYNRSIYPMGEFFAIKVRYEEDRAYKGRIEMVVVIRDRESIRELNTERTRVWLGDARRWLDEFQGPKLNSETQFMEKIVDLYRNGISDQNLADRINSHLAELLRGHVAARKVEDEVEKQIDLDFHQLMDYIEDLGHNPFAGAEATTIMAWLGLAEQEISRSVNEGIQNIKEGRSYVFLPDSPIDRQRIRNQAVKWENRWKGRNA